MYFFAETFCFPFVWKTSIIACWNTCIIAALKSLSGNFNIYVLSAGCQLLIVFSHVSWDFPVVLYAESCGTASWTFWIEWDSGSCLNPMKNVDTFYQVIDLVG